MSEPAPGAATGKGRPTPKRRDAASRRGGPVAPPPTTRREAARRVREQAAEQRRLVRAGTRVGDERFLVGRDRGPVRALVRDVVDSRRHVGVVLLPAAFLPLAAQLTGNPSVLSVATGLWLAALVAAVGDFMLTATAVRRQVRRRFPDATGLGGHALYGVVRTAQFRRFRQPPPRVAPGARV